MKYEIHYKDGTWELIRANSLTEAKNQGFFYGTCVPAIQESLMEEYITMIKVL